MLKSSLITVLVSLLTSLVVTTESATAAEAGSVRYVSDKLTVPLRSGPSNSHRILHRGLPSGTRLTVLAEDQAAGFVNIRTDRGTEGWIPTQYLMNQPIARDRLAAAQREVAAARARLNKSREELAGLQQTGASSAAENQNLKQRIAVLEAELTEVKTISADALEQYSANKRLTELNVRLRDELDDLMEDHQKLEGNLQQQWLLTGAGLLLGGLVLGVVIKARPRRSGWS